MLHFSTLETRRNQMTVIWKKGQWCSKWPTSEFSCGCRHWSLPRNNPFLRSLEWSAPSQQQINARLQQHKWINRCRVVWNAMPPRANWRAKVALGRRDAKVVCMRCLLCQHSGKMKTSLLQDGDATATVAFLATSFGCCLSKEINYLIFYKINMNWLFEF